MLTDGRMGGWEDMRDGRMGGMEDGREDWRIGGMEGREDATAPVSGEVEGSDRVRLGDDLVGAREEVVQDDVLVAVLAVSAHQPPAVRGDGQVVDAPAMPVPNLVAFDVPHEPVQVSTI
jgi:hypothetical protein